MAKVVHILMDCIFKQIYAHGFKLNSTQFTNASKSTDTSKILQFFPTVDHWYGTWHCDHRLV